MNEVDQPQHDKSEEQAYNQAHVIPAKLHHGREPDKVKPLAQYLGEYIEQEVNVAYIANRITFDIPSWRELLEQALDAYESTEGVKIRIERI